MIPKKRIKAIVTKHNNLEKELSTGNIKFKKLCSEKSKEYSDLGNIINYARDYLNLKKKKKTLIIN